MKPAQEATFKSKYIRAYLHVCVANTFCSFRQTSMAPSTMPSVVQEPVASQ